MKKYAFVLVAALVVACDGAASDDGSFGAGGLQQTWIGCPVEGCDRSDDFNLKYGEGADPSNLPSISIGALDLKPSGEMVLSRHRVDTEISADWIDGDGDIKHGQWEVEGDRLTLFFDEAAATFQWSRSGPGLRLLGAAGTSGYFETLRRLPVGNVLAEGNHVVWTGPTDGLQGFWNSEGEPITVDHNNPIYMDVESTGAVAFVRGLTLDTGGESDPLLDAYPYVFRNTIPGDYDSDYFLLVCVGVGQLSIGGNEVIVAIEGGPTHRHSTSTTLRRRILFEGMTCENSLREEPCGMRVPRRFWPENQTEGIEDYDVGAVCRQLGVPPMGSNIFDPSSW